MNTWEQPEEGWIINLGRAGYARILDLQRTLVRLRQQGSIPDLLLLVEHEPVITLGKRGGMENILATAAELARLGIRVYPVERGGDVTYHGPGQLVGYPILHLIERKLSVRDLVARVEETILRALADFNIQAERHSSQRGVWVQGRKVAALGIAVKRWVSYHGFALNVSPDLSHFCTINPCGLESDRVTSMQAVLGGTPDMKEVAGAVTARFTEVFPGRWRRLSGAVLQGAAPYPTLDTVGSSTYWFS